MLKNKINKSFKRLEASVLLKTLFKGLLSSKTLPMVLTSYATKTVLVVMAGTLMALMFGFIYLK